MFTIEEQAVAIEAYFGLKATAESGFGWLVSINATPFPVEDSQKAILLSPVGPYTNCESGLIIVVSPELDFKLAVLGNWYMDLSDPSHAEIEKWPPILK